MPTSTKTALLGETPKPPTTTPLPHIPATPAPSITPTAPHFDLVNEYGLGFRIIYVTYEVDNQNEITGSELWSLGPENQNPQLLQSFSATTGDGSGDVILFPIFPETRNDRMLAFARVTKDQMVIVAAINLQSGELEQLVGPVSERDYQIALNRFGWSSDGNWLYTAFDDGAATVAGIVDVETKKIHFLNYEVQDELLSWSPSRPSQYAYISHPKFPERGGETINIGEIGSAEPVATIGEFRNFTLLDKFAWSPDGEKAIIQSVSYEGVPTYLLLDFRKQTWSELLADQDLSVTP
jgi:hypothetical protein